MSVGTAITGIRPSVIQFSSDSCTLFQKLMNIWGVYRIPRNTVVPGYCTCTLYPWYLYCTVPCTLGSLDFRVQVQLYYDTVVQVCCSTLVLRVDPPYDIHAKKGKIEWSRISINSNDFLSIVHGGQAPFSEKNRTEVGIWDHTRTQGIFLCITVLCHHHIENRKQTQNPEQ